MKKNKRIISTIELNKKEQEIYDALDLAIEKNPATKKKAI